MRAACAFALGAFVAAGGARSEHGNALNQQVGIALAARLAPDASALVRAEILAGTHRTAPHQRARHPRSLTRVLMFAALQWLVLIFEQYFIAVHIQERERRSER